MPLCSNTRCGREARMAISTSRPSRADLRSVVHYDDRAAPKRASRYCKQCGMALLVSLTQTLTHDDEVDTPSTPIG